MQKKYPQIGQQVAGIDEAGRGPLAGPVVAAAVVLPSQVNCKLGDSKSLSLKDRENSFIWLTQNSIWSIGLSSSKEIDQINILQATLLAMKRAINGLQSNYDQVLIDGRDCIDITTPQQAIIKGDQHIPEIQAASIIAKVYRDRLMSFIDYCYPEYGFAKHKGYGTQQHRSAINMHGPCEQHRMSFAPIKQTV